MGRISDPRLVRMLENGETCGLPPDVAFHAARLSRLLLHATEWRDLTIFTDPFPHGELHAAGVTSKWAILFRWDEGIGASELQLQRV